MWAISAETYGGHRIVGTQTIFFRRRFAPENGPPNFQIAFDATDSLYRHRNRGDTVIRDRESMR